MSQTNGSSSEPSTQGQQQPHFLQKAGCTATPSPSASTEAPPPQPLPQPPAAPTQPEQPAAAEEPEPIPVFVTAEAAEAARTEALKLYNSGDYNGALRLQCGVLTYYTQTYGQLAPECGARYLDYGLTLLTLIQCEDPESAILHPDESEEDYETCYQNLQTALLCLDKLQKLRPEDDLVKMRIAEAHDGLAQLYQELEQDEEAIKELEEAVLVYKSATVPNKRLLAATNHSLGVVYLRDEIYETAQKYLTEAISLAKECPDVNPTIIEEMQVQLDEATEHASHPEQMNKCREEIRGLFPDEASQVKDPEDVLISQGDNVPSKFVGVLPGGESSATHSSSLLMTTCLVTAGVPPRETSNSLSIFPPQGDYVPAAAHGPITVVPVKRKLKAEKDAGEASSHARPLPPPAAASEEPALKKARTEATPPPTAAASSKSTKDSSASQ